VEKSLLTETILETQFYWWKWYQIYKFIDKGDTRYNLVQKGDARYMYI